MPATDISSESLTDDAIGILDLLVLTKLAPSKGEGRRLIQQGGVSVDDVKVTDPQFLVKKSEAKNGYVIIKKGKKVFHRVNF